MGEEEKVPIEIHNITIKRLEDDRFRILLGTETGIADLYSASTIIELSRDLLEQFVENAQEALKKGVK